MIQEFKQVFGGGINLDLDDLAMQIGQTREIHNLRFDNFHSANQGALSTFKGTQLMTNEVALPPGTNVVIGAKAYHEENAIIFFVYNSERNHSIRMYNPYLGTVTTILQQNYRGAVRDTGVWRYDLNFFSAARITHINIIGDLLFWVNTANEPNRINIKRAIYFNNNMSQGYSIIDASVCRAAKSPPILPPTANYGTDLKRSFANLLRGNNYQFRYSFVYEDGDLSTTSPISRALFASGDFDVTGASNPQDKKNNVIMVNVMTGAPEIKYIRIYVQANNLGDWTLFKEIDKDKENIPDNATYSAKFYGTELGYGVDQKYVNRLFSRVPILARSQEFIDNKYLVYGGIVDGRNYITNKNVRYSLRAEKINLTNNSGEPTERIMDVSQYSVTGEIGDINPDPIGGDDNPPSGGIGAFITVYPPEAQYYTIGNQIYIKIIRDKDNATIEITDLYVTETNRNDLPAAMTIKINMAAAWLDARPAYQALNNKGVAVWDINYSPITVLAKEIGFILTGYDSAAVAGGIKFGATTGIGIVYSDRDGRLSGTNEITDLNIPWYNELRVLPQGATWSESDPGRMLGISDNEYRYRILVDLEIAHKPPTWAHAMHIVATRPMQVGSYFQTRVSFSNVTNKPYVIMDLSAYNKKANKNEFGNSNLRAYIFKQGDRVRLISINTSGGSIGNYDNRINRYVEAEIIGYNLNDDGSIKADEVRVAGNNITPLITSRKLGAFVEIYSPTAYGDLRVYREILTLPIGNAGSAAYAYHHGNVGNQNNIEPAKITIDMVNCLHHPRHFGEDTSVGMVEDTTYSDFAKSIDAVGMGRTNVYDKSIKEVYRNALIYSEPYFDNTNINGLAMFPPDDRYKPLSDEKGDITALRYSGNTLIVWLERDNQSIYVGKAGLAQAQQDGREIVVSTDQVLSSTYPSLGGYGTAFPESVVMVGRNAYFFDLAHSAIMRRSVNGIDPISDMYGIRKDIVAMADIMKQHNDVYVVAGYNPKYNEVYFTFVARTKAGVTLVNKTWVFGVASEDRNEFKYVIDLTNAAGAPPSCFINNGDEFFSFLDGSMWKHDATNETNKFYGKYHPYDVTFVVNPEPDTIKTFDTIALVTNKRWDMVATIKPAENTPHGMETSLSAKEFVSEEGGIYSDIHGNSINQHTGTKSVYQMINGELMRGHAMTVKLSGTSTTPVYLIVAKFGYSYSSVS